MDPEVVPESLEGGAARALSESGGRAREELEVLGGRHRERGFWDAYQAAYSEMVRTRAPRATWYVVPADHKWSARVAASAIIADALMGHRSAVPPQSKTNQRRDPGGHHARRWRPRLPRRRRPGPVSRHEQQGRRGERREGRRRGVTKATAAGARVQPASGEVASSRATPTVSPGASCGCPGSGA